MMRIVCVLLLTGITAVIVAGCGQTGGGYGTETGQGATGAGNPVPKPNPAAFTATFTGAAEVPAVDTKAKGNAKLTLSADGKELSYDVWAWNISDITMAHLHMAPAGQNGEVVFWLYPTEGQTAKLIAGGIIGTIAKGTITAAKLVGPLQGKTIQDLVDKIKAGDIYVQVHTQAHAEGEIRGQLK